MTPFRIEGNKYADDNEVYLYKDRTIDISRPMRVFRNKTKGEGWYSIQQDRRTVAHSTAVCLTNARFVVNDKGRQRVLKTGQKEFHAYIEGYYETSGMGTTAARNDLPVKVEYNPFENDTFVCKNVTIRPFIVNHARFVICNKDGVRAAYTN